MGVLDTAGDLIHRVVSTVTGAISPGVTPDKPAYTAEDASHHLGTGAVDQAAKAVSGRQKQIDDAVRDAGG